LTSGRRSPARYGRERASGADGSLRRPSRASSLSANSQTMKHVPVGAHVVHVAQAENLCVRCSGGRATAALLPF
jgi:hypothetical protein